MHYFFFGKSLKFFIHFSIKFDPRKMGPIYGPLCREGITPSSHHSLRRYVVLDVELVAVMVITVVLVMALAFWRFKGGV